MPVPAKTSESGLLEIKGPAKTLIIATVVGVTELRTRRMSDQAVRALAGVKPKPNEKDSPEEDFQQAIYWGHDPVTGVPFAGMIAAAFRRAMVDSVRSTDGQMVKVKQMFKIKGRILPVWTFNERGERVHAMPQHVVDVPNNQKKGATLSNRAEFALPWEIDVPIVYNANVVSEKAILELLNLAGFSVGIGTYRQECMGIYGEFELKSVQKGPGA